MASKTIEIKTSKSKIRKVLYFFGLEYLGVYDVEIILKYDKERYKNGE